MAQFISQENMILEQSYFLNNLYNDPKFMNIINLSIFRCSRFSINEILFNLNCIYLIRETFVCIAYRKYKKIYKPGRAVPTTVSSRLVVG